jgi:outer membrane protein TolC
MTLGRVAPLLALALALAAGTAGNGAADAHGAAVPGRSPERRQSGPVLLAAAQQVAPAAPAASAQPRGVASPAPATSGQGAATAPASRQQAAPGEAVPAPQTPQTTSSPVEAAPGTPATPSVSPGVPAAGTAEGRRVVPVSLQEAIALTFQNNLDIKAEALNPEIQAQNVIEQRAAFDPTARAEALAVEDRSPGVTDRPGNDRRISGEVGLEQVLPWGTQYDVSYATDRTRTATTLFGGGTAEFYSADVLLQVTQPLLRNFGRGVNQTAIVLAQNQERIARSTFLQQIQASLFTTVQAYWGLVQAQDALEVARESLRLAQRLLQQNRVQVQVGTLAPIEVTQAEAGVAAREEDVIRAEAAVADAEDRLKRQLLIDEQNVFDYTLVTSDRPDFVPVQVELAPNLAAASRLRPELAAARTAVESSQVSERLARNLLLPELNAVGSLGVNTADDDFAGAQRDLPSEAGDQYRWSAGLVFRYPLGNRAARSNVTEATLALRQSQTQLRSLELAVTEEVRSAVRAVNTNIKRVEATREASRLAREQLAAEERRLAVGLSTSFEVLQLQTDLADAQNREIQAITDYRVSLANLDRVVGTLLERFGIQVRQ